MTALDEKGRPTPLAATMMRAPMSRMDVLTHSELEALFDASKLILKYNETVDRESAYEMLNEKIKTAQDIRAKQEEQETLEKERKRQSSSSSRRSTRMHPVVKVLTSATFIRSVFGVLKKVMK